MLLDTCQYEHPSKGRILSIAYYGKDHKTHIYEYKLKDSDMFEWIELKHGAKTKPDATVTNWNGNPVAKKNIDLKKKTAKLSKYRVMEIIDNLPKDVQDEIFEYNLPDIYFCDIETEWTEQTGYSSPEKAENQIQVIGVCTPKNQIIVMSTKDLTEDEKRSVQVRINDHCKTVVKKNSEYTFIFMKYASETEMLADFLYKMVPKMPLLTGWNFNEFDWKWICNRSKLLGLDLAKMSPIGQGHGNKEGSWTPAHVYVVDYMEVYKKWDRSVKFKENFKLDTAGKDVMGVRKVEYEGTLQYMYENDYSKFVYYNAIDCILLKMIHDKIHTLDVGLTTCSLNKIELTNMFSTIAGTESQLTRAYNEHGHVLAQKEANVKTDGYEGAYVKDPKVGFHEMNVCFDYASLYPTTMRQLNISPESYVDKINVDDLKNPETLEKFKKYHTPDYIIAQSGAVFKKEDSYLKKIITDLYAQRKAYKKESFKAKQKAYEIQQIIDNAIIVD